MHSFDGVFLLYTISREIINPRRACAARVTVVGFSVCPLVANSLQERLFVRSSNEGQKICGVFSETAPLPRSSTPSVVRPCV